MLDPAIHLRNLLRRTRAELRRKYCLHPDASGDCSKRIISAHTVQRAILAKYIAVENHVLRFEVEPLADPMRGMLVYPKRRGINRATTFFGFCDKHDCELFRPLEAIEFAFQPEQIALLGYRAICRDAYGKEAEIAAGDAARFYVMMHPDISGFPEKNYAYQIKRLSNVKRAQKLYEGSRPLREDDHKRQLCRS